MVSLSIQMAAASFGERVLPELDWVAEPPLSLVVFQVTLIGVDETLADRSAV